MDSRSPHNKLPTGPISSTELVNLSRIEAQSNLGWKVDLSLGYALERLFSSLDVTELQPS